MSVLYIDDSKAKISIDQNRIVVTTENSKRMIPIETVDGITLLGNPQLTTPLLETCLKKGINVNFFSKGGKYFGRLMSTGHVKASLQRQQSALYDSDFSLQLSKQIITAKIRNQRVVLRRYMSNAREDLAEDMKMLRICEKKVDYTDSVQSLMGFEGQAAKAYFHGLSKCVDSNFAFQGRNRRPPKDPFNSMLSLGYSILMNELYEEIENRGLNPYFGFLHRDSENHPTLASDMMEEWRAVIVDSTVMALINGHEIHKEQFVTDEDKGCYLTKHGLDIFLRKLEKKLQMKAQYLDYVDFATSFRRAISLQAQKLEEAITLKDPSVYHAIKIR